MRLDKFLAEAGLGSRKEVKSLIKKGLVTVNGQVEKSDKQAVDPATDKITYADEVVGYQEYYYYLLNKPAGVLSATEDKKERTVMDLFTSSEYRQDLFPVGRLDKDTEGLLLITNDGQLAHRLLSPKKHVEKEYYAEVKGAMAAEDQQQFEKGMLMDGKQTLPAQLLIDKITDETSFVRIVLHEGRFHQVKRMVKRCGKEVTYLKRIRMGNLLLPEELPKGGYRPLTSEELERLKEGGRPNEHSSQCV